MRELADANSASLPITSTGGDAHPNKAESLPAAIVPAVAKLVKYTAVAGNLGPKRGELKCSEGTHE